MHKHFNIKIIEVQQKIRYSNTKKSVYQTIFSFP